MCNAESITVDLVRDFANLQTQSLLTNGVKLTGQETDDEVLLLAQKYEMRVISPTRRQVLRATSFTVPSGSEAAVVMITKEIAAGHDLKPRLSRRILKTRARDDMLADFGIHHLHCNHRSRLA